jgi:hypothetical protein
MLVQLDKAEDENWFLQASVVQRPIICEPRRSVCSVESAVAEVLERPAPVRAKRMVAKAKQQAEFLLRNSQRSFLCPNRNVKRSYPLGIAASFE